MFSDHFSSLHLIYLSTDSFNLYSTPEHWLMIFLQQLYTWYSEDNRNVKHDNQLLNIYIDSHIPKHVAEKKWHRAKANLANF